MAKNKRQYKQCTIQFTEDNSYACVWVEVGDAIKDKVINMNTSMFSLKGKAIVLQVYNNITIDDDGKTI